jgi:hypothetical protein
LVTHDKSNCLLIKSSFQNPPGSPTKRSSTLTSVDDLSEILGSVLTAVNEVRGRLFTELAVVGERIDGVEDRLDVLEERMAATEQSTVEQSNDIEPVDAVKDNTDENSED